MDNIPEKPQQNESEPLNEKNVTPEQILSINDFVGIEIPRVEELPRLAMSEQSSYKRGDDSNKIYFLLSCGINLPEDWYELKGGIVPNPEFHAEIVTTTIIMNHMKHVFWLIEKKIPREKLEKAIAFHSQWLINKRINRDNLRDPDVAEEFRNTEMAIKSVGTLCNARAQVSPMELRELVVLVINSFKTREA